MESWILGVVLGMLVMGMLALILRLEACHRGLISALKDSRDDLVGAIGNKSDISVSDSVLELIREEISQTIGDVAGAMRVPTAIDHLGGVIANVIQMREQWKIQKEAQELNANPLISQPTPEEAHGATT